MTVPGFPGAATISGLVGKVNFLALATPILGYAGIYTGKFRFLKENRLEKIIMLALFVIFGTYIGSAIIADVVLRIIGQI